jgi:cyclopropane fatty-acyl-phospholipid synthase-like methyltransferase
MENNMKKNNNNQNVAQVFDGWAKRGQADKMAVHHEKAARAGFDLLRLSGKEWYLDIGCGNGYSVRWAAAVAPSVQAVGIDASAEMITLCKNQSKTIPNTNFMCDRFPSRQLAGKQFDAIFSMETLYYVEDLQAALEAVFQHLTSQGRFVLIIDYYQENKASHSWPEELGVAMQLLSIDEWDTQLQTAGFKLVDRHQLGDSLIFLLKKIGSD